MKKELLFLMLLVFVTSSLKATKNCQVKDPAIQKKAKSLKGKTQRETAEKIFNFVKKRISYESYSNSHKGAVKTLLAGKGNCCDQAHLLVALLRADGIPTYYAHGTNHWWAVPCIDKQYHCDPTNQKHQFGYPQHGQKHKNFTLHNSLNH